MKVAHFIKRYLPRSETFIYEEIRNIKGVSQILLTKMVENLELFPYPSEIFKDSSLFKHILKENDVGLIHARFAYGGIEMLNLSKRLNIPLLTTFSGMDVYRFPRHLIYKRKLLRLFQEGDMFLVRSHLMEEDVVNLGCPPDKIQVLYGGIDIDKFCCRKARESTNGPIRILMCGRFVEKKGLKYGIHAFGNISSKYKDTELRIIGYGKLQKELEELCKRLSLEERVRFLGPLSHEKVREEMTQATFFLAPSITARNGDKEGIPNVIKEAMACGLPVISTLHSGIPELVRDGKTGFLVKERDVSELVDRLDYLITHPEIWKELGGNGRKVVEERFNIKKQVRKLEEIYQSLIDKHFR
ncbi:MAG: glycosyltransferase [bacterium]|nr:glycosyltransferase [bacterium]